jgi:hypothetical protein
MSPRDDVRRARSRQVHGFRQLLTRKWWLGATGVIAAIGVLVPVGLWLADRSPASTITTKNQINAHNGNCVILGGSGNSCDVKQSSAPLGPGSPLTVAITKDIGPCAHAWMVSRRSSSVPKPPLSNLTPEVWASWARAVGAVDAGRTDVTATIQAKPGDVVYITGIQFSVSQRRPPIHGTLAAPTCAGPTYGRFVAVHLDPSPPRVFATSSDPRALVGVAPGALGLKVKPFTLPYKVTNSDGLVLILEAQAKKFDCVWSAEILWSSNGRNGSVRIDNNGRPFETTPLIDG